MSTQDNFIRHSDRTITQQTRFGLAKLEVDKQLGRIRLSFDKDCDGKADTTIEASLDNHGTYEVRGAERALDTFQHIAKKLVAMGGRANPSLETMGDMMRNWAHLNPGKICR